MIRMIEFGFVILHYITYEMTRACVDAIMRLNLEQAFHVVIVDNGSENGSGELLKKHYETIESVTVLLTGENLGFAKGNNVGYKYLKEFIEPRFMVVMNNDVIIRDVEFANKVIKIYEKKHFAILGPDIQNPIFGNHQNPERLMPRSYKDVKDRVDSLAIKNKYPHLSYCLSKIKRALCKSEKSKSKSNVYDGEYENIVLHGSCLILSPLFCEVRELCFNPNTFLYHEEDILYYECNKMDLKITYSPMIYVEHYEDVSTNASFTSEFKKQRMQNKWLLDSAKVLLDLMAK